MNPMLFFVIILFTVKTAYAVCPLCTFAVGAGIGLAQYIGIDDTITGFWIGGLIVSLITWTIRYLDKKDIHFYGRKILIVTIYYCSVIVPFYKYGIIGHALNKFLNMDKVLFGIIVGSVAFFGGVISYEKLKKKNNKVCFPFQKIVMPVLPLIILSVIFYYLTK